MTRILWTLANALAVLAATAASALVLAPVAAMLAGAGWQNGPSLEHLAVVYGDAARLGTLARNSLAAALVAVAVAVPAGAALGFLAFRTRLPGRGALVAGAVLAAGVPLYVTATAWAALLGNGCWFGLTHWFPQALLTGAVTGAAYAPAVMLLTGAVFAAGDPALEEQARLDSAWPGIVRRVSLPQAAWGLAAAAVLVAVWTLADITVSDTVRLRTFAEETYSQFQLPDVRATGGEDPGRVKLGRAAAVALPAVVVGGLLLVWIGRGLGSHGRSSAAARARLPQRLGLGRWRWPVAALALGAAGALWLAPLAALVRAVGSWGNLLNAWGATREELVNSLLVAPAAATGATLLALAWARVWSRWRGAAQLGVVLLLAAPAPLVGVGLILCLNHQGLGWLYDSRAVLVLASVVRTLPYAVLALLPAVRAVPRALLEAARLDGANGLQRLLSVELPLVWRGLAVAWLLTLVLALGEVGAAVLVCPPGYPTLAIRFFTLIHYQVYADAAGLCLLGAALVVLPAAILGACVWRHLARRLA